jgi:predicted RNA-binding protein YlqC (UPF0109 family)
MERMPDPRDVSVYHTLYKVVCALAERPHDVLLQTVFTQEGAVFTLRMHTEDMLRLNGEHGRQLDAVRTILEGAAERSARRYELVIGPSPVAADQFAEQIKSQ